MEKRTSRTPTVQTSTTSEKDASGEQTTYKKVTATLGRVRRGSTLRRTKAGNDGAKDRGVASRAGFITKPVMTTLLRKRATKTLGRPKKLNTAASMTDMAKKMLPGRLFKTKSVAQQVADAFLDSESFDKVSNANFGSINYDSSAPSFDSLDNKLGDSFNFHKFFDEHVLDRKDTIETDLDSKKEEVKPKKKDNDDLDIFSPQVQSARDGKNKALGAAFEDDIEV